MASADSSRQQIHALYIDHHNWLFGWLRRKLGCADNAADLAQDTFVRLMARPRLLNAEEDPRAYLTTIAHGLVVDHWRRQEIERAWLATLAAYPEAEAPSAEHQAVVLETLMEIDRLLASLPEKPRRCFLLAHLHDMAYADIAVELGVSERMVKKYMAQVMLHCLTSGATFRAAFA